MTARRLWILLAGAALAGAAVGPSPAAVKVRQPILEEPTAGAAEPAATAGSEESYFVGTIIFSGGGQIVAEIPGGARERERFVVFDAGLRRRGKAVAVRQLERGVFLLDPESGVSASMDDKLARESETEAAARVIRENRLDSYREFLAVFPKSKYRPRVGREMFRLAMRAGYPTFPGSVVEGKLVLAEAVGRELSLGQVEIVLDRFVITRTDERGRFRIEGLPKLDEGVALKLRVRDPKFRNAEAVEIDLPGESFGEVAADLPVNVTPTVLAGRVVDERGAPLPGAEVWTSPYSMEVLTDDQGAYGLSRRKKVDAAGAAAAEDEPLFGADYEVYAYRKGYTVDRVPVSAESYRENEVPVIRLARQETRQEDVPALGLALKSFLELAPATVGTPLGSGPKLNP